MRTITKEKTNVVKYNVFIANDGTEFTDAEECKKYEKSAFAVINTKYQQLVIGRTNEEELLGAGNDECTIDALRIESQKDADVVLQMYIHYNHTFERPYEELDEASKEYFDKRIALLRKALDNHELLFVTRGADYDDMWIFATTSTLVDRIHNVIRNFEKKEE